MRIMSKILTATAVLLVASVAAVPVHAVCGAPQVVGSAASATAKSFIFTENWPADFSYGVPFVDGTAPISANRQVKFWQQGAGNVAGGVGIDNGTFNAAPFIYFASSGTFYYGAEMFFNWASPGIDNCLATNQCMCLLMTDTDGSSSYYAALGKRSNANGDSFFNQGGSQGDWEQSIVLNSIPAAKVSASVRNQTTFDVDLTVGLPLAFGGVYLKDGCACGPTGFKVLQMILPRGSMPPANRTATAWTTPNTAAGPAQGVTPTTGSVTIRSACGGALNDVWLTTQLFFDSGFTTSIVSANSSRVECGPSLADPNDRPTTIRPLDRPATGTRPNPRGK